jgi:hypothetical protein
MWPFSIQDSKVYSFSCDVAAKLPTQKSVGATAKHTPLRTLHQTCPSPGGFTALARRVTRYQPLSGTRVGGMRP